MFSPTFAILAWIPIGTLLLAARRPVYGLATCYIAGWLLVPTAGIPVEGLPNIDKPLVINLSAALGVALFHSQWISFPRLRFPDVLFLAFLGSTVLTSLYNGLGLKDGLSSALRQIMRYGMPYFIGRSLIQTREDLQLAARVVVVGAAAYAFLAVWEWRMSPQLNYWVYGFHQYVLVFMRRWEFYRPVVFFQSSLALATFFAWAALLALPTFRETVTPGRINYRLLIAGLVLGGFLSTMSLGPYVLFSLGGLAYWGWERWKAHRLLWAALVFGCFWMSGRYTGTTDGRWLTRAVASFAPERAESLAYRVHAEDLLADRARERRLLGWGGWGRNRVRSAEGKDLVATDGLWIIYLGNFGLLGLALFLFWWLWPLLLSGFSGMLDQVGNTEKALLIIIAVQFLNFLFNAFLDPPLVLLAGGLTSVLYESSKTPRRVAHGALQPIRRSGRVRPTPLVGQASRQHQVIPADSVNARSPRLSGEHT